MSVFQILNVEGIEANSGLFIDTAGLVGVGMTSSLLANLHVRQTGSPANDILRIEDASANVVMYIDDVAAGVAIGSTNLSGVVYTNPKLIINTGADVGFMHFSTVNDVELISLMNVSDSVFGNASNHDFALMTNNLERVKVTAAGAVGINHLTPPAQLTVVGSGNTSATHALTIANSSSSPLLNVRDDGRIVAGYPDSGLPATWGHTFASPTAGGTDFAFHVGTSGLTEGRFNIYNNGSFELGHNNSTIINFGLDQPNANFYFQGGNVGIGLTSPVAKLEVIGNGTGYTQLVTFSDNSSADKFFMYDNGETYFDPLSGFQTVKHTSGRWDFPNTVSVGGPTVVAGDALTIKGSDATSSNYAIKAVNSASADLLHVRNDGNIGVGTTTPKAKLQIFDSTQGLLVGNSTGGAFANTAAFGLGATYGVIGFINGTDVGTTSNWLWHLREDGGAGTANFYRAGTIYSKISAISGGNRIDLKTDAGADAFSVNGPTGEVYVNNLVGVGTRVVNVDSVGKLVAGVAIGSAVDGSGTASYIPRWVDTNTLENGEWSNTNSELHPALPNTVELTVPSITPSAGTQFRYSSANNTTLVTETYDGLNWDISGATGWDDFATYMNGAGLDYDVSWDGIASIVTFKLKVGATAGSIRLTLPGAESYFLNGNAFGAAGPNDQEMLYQALGSTYNRVSNIFANSIQIQDGNQGTGKVWTSTDNAGNGAWGVVPTSKYATTFTPGTEGVANTITHSLGTTDISVTLWDAVVGDIIYANVDNRTTTQVDVTFTTNPSGNVRVVVIG